MSQLREFFTHYIMWFSIILFCFTLFRFRLHTYRKQLFLIAFVMASVGYCIHVLHLEPYRPLLYDVFFNVCMVAFLRIHWRYAILMVLSTYAFTACYWYVMNWVVAGFSREWLIQIIGDRDGLRMQLNTLYLFLITFILRRLRLGFTFIPNYRKTEPGPIPVWMKVTLTLGGLTLILRAASLSVWKELKPWNVAIAFVLLIVLIYFIYTKESSD